MSEVTYGEDSVTLAFANSRDAETVDAVRLLLEGRPLADLWRMTVAAPEGVNDSSARRVGWVGVAHAISHGEPVPAEVIARLTLDELPDPSDDDDARAQLGKLFASLDDTSTRDLFERAIAADDTSIKRVVPFLARFPDLAERLVRNADADINDRRPALDALDEATAARILAELVAEPWLSPATFALVARRPIATLLASAFAALDAGGLAAMALDEGLADLVSDNDRYAMARPHLVAILARFPDEPGVRAAFERHVADDAAAELAEEATRSLARAADFRYDGEHRAALHAARELGYEMADFDVSDHYTFHLEHRGDALRVRYLDGRNGASEFSRAALNHASRFSHLSQQHLSRARDRNDLPPFLLSRDLLRALRDGKASLQPEFSEDRIELGDAKREIRRLRVGELDVVVPVLVATTDSMSLVVVDDEELPLILRRDEVDDTYWRMSSIA